MFKQRRRVVVETPVEGTLFVSPNGSDDNDGKTIKTAFRTITGADRHVKPGYTVIVLRGTYIYPVSTRTDGQARKRILWKSAQASIVVPPGDVVVWNNIASFVDILGFRIAGGRVGLRNLGHKVTIVDCDFHDIGWRCTTEGGCGVYSGGQGCTIHGCSFSNIGVFDPDCKTYHGMVAAGAVVSDNAFERISGAPIKWL